MVASLVLSRAPPLITLLGFLCVRKKEEERNRTCFCKSYSGLKVNLYSERIDDLILIYLFIYLQEVKGRLLHQVLQGNDPNGDVPTMTQWRCNIPDFRFLNDSHITTLYDVTLHSTSLLIRTFHQSESSIDNFFRDLENHLCLPSGSMTDPINQHKTFQHILSSLTCFSRNFSKSHPSQNYSKPSTLNYGVLK